MHRGFVKIHRKLTEWEWYTDSNTMHLFIHLLISANHKPKKWRGVDVDRGQLITSRDSLTAQTGISQMSIRTCLKRLESSGEITVKSTNRFTLITIINYGSYQDKEAEANQQLTNNQPATNQQLTTNKNEKKVKNEKKTSSSVNSNESPAPWREKYDSDLILFVEGFAAYAKQQHEAMAPNVTESLLKTGADTVDKLIRIDRHNFQTIVEVMRWAVTDDFWGSNVLSLAGLRKKKDGVTKFQKILGGYHRGRKQSITTGDVLDEMIRRVESGQAIDGNGEQGTGVYSEAVEDDFFAPPSLLTES